MISKLTTENIPQGNYEGYLWYADATKPVIIEGDFTPDQLTDFPFVVEGFLFDEKAQKSISIKHINGQYFVTAFDLNKADKDTVLQDRTYGGNGVHFNIKVKELWMPKVDKVAMAGMKTLQPVAQIFCGFDK
ncbi:hypothetical protein PEPS_43400 (plasmid) [Persicobacter psychrovividus]|uniref:Uncharacterized protein n=2 Tax=Persicobacter psychrovividus TaxID=387638 RepID=A0ABM7VMB5_9BACT|nr:hypothetical protein PEPS_43400 [Persicobacter psychrovividus]